MSYSVNGLAIQWNCQTTLYIGLDTNALIRNDREATKIKRIILQMPVIKSNKLKTAAGKAFYHHPNLGPHIKLHAALYDNRDNVSYDRFDTFFHEIAHHIAYLTVQERGHGHRWAYCMQHFGFEPSRCYDGKQFNYRKYKDRKENREVDDVIDEFLGDFELEL